MAWIERRKRRDGTPGQYRIRDYVNKKAVTIVRNAGLWKDLANARLAEYNKQKSADPAGIAIYRLLPIEKMCDLNLEHYGPTLKGGINNHYLSAHYGYRMRMEQVKRFWNSKQAHDITETDVGKFLAQFNTVGTRMRWIGVLGRLFSNFAKWNGTAVLGHVYYKLPAKNPVHQYRSEMKPSEKKEHPDKRVLSEEEWNDFKIHLTVRARQICEIALQRFLRLADIRRLTNESQFEDAFEKKGLYGLQQKTGAPFLVPLIAGHPVKYDFTNFRRDFACAQIKAGMIWPAYHPMHFSPKDLRRTGAIWAYRKTRDIVTISKMLGHQRLATTERYLNVVDLTDAYRLTKILDELAAGKGTWEEQKNG